MVKVIVGQDDLFHGDLAATGGQSPDLVQDIAVGARVDEGVNIFDAVPIAQDQIGITAVNLRIFVERNDLHAAVTLIF